MASLPVWSREPTVSPGDLPHIRVILDGQDEILEDGAEGATTGAAVGASEAGGQQGRRRLTSFLTSTPRRLLQRASNAASNSLSYLTPPSSFAGTTDASAAAAAAGHETVEGRPGAGTARRRRRGQGRGRRRISTSQMFDEMERFSRRTISTSTYSSAVAQEVSDALLGHEAPVAVEEPPYEEAEGGGAGAREERKEGDPDIRDNEHAISNFETMVHIIKGNIGIGIITLPMAIRNAGLMLGAFGIMGIAMISVYCMKLLVRSAHRACAKRPGVHFLDYADTAEAAFTDAGGRWPRYACFARRLVNVFLCLSQLFSNAVYVLFIAQNIQPVFIKYGGEFFHTLNYRYYILFLLGPMILLCFVRNLRYLSPFSILATLAQTVGLSIIFYYIFREPLPNSHSVPWVAEPSRLPLFFGTAIFAIEGISIVLPIENQMKRPKEMLGFCGVLNTSMTIVAAMYVAMGFFGYLKYGESISACITLNLPINDILTQVVLCLFCFAIFISYALQFYVIIDIVQRNFLLPRLGEESRWLVPAEMLVRILINLVTFCFAATVPWLDLVVSLLGAVKMSTLALMMPAIIDTASYWNDLGRCRFRLIRNALIFLFGLFGCIMGTFTSIRDIVENFKHG